MTDHPLDMTKNEPSIITNHSERKLPTRCDFDLTCDARQRFFYILSCPKYIAGTRHFFSFQVDIELFSNRKCKHFKSKITSVIQWFLMLTVRAHLSCQRRRKKRRKNANLPKLKCIRNTMKLEISQFPDGLFQLETKKWTRLKN